MLSKKYRLSEKYIFKRLLTKGYSRRGRYGKLVIYIENNKQDYLTKLNPKFAVITSKKIGKAVKRNLQRRRVYSVFEDLLEKGHIKKVTEKKIYYLYIVFNSTADQKQIYLDIINLIKS